MDLKEELLKHSAMADAGRTCKRKGVACGLIYCTDKIDWHFNGPIGNKGELCSGERGNCGCIHAEFPAVVSAIRWYAGKKFSLLVNYSPCTSCANLIIVSRVIERVYYVIPTEHDLRGIKHLEKAGIEVCQL